MYTEVSEMGPPEVTKARWMYLVLDKETFLYIRQNKEACAWASSLMKKCQRSFIQLS